jgi:hypothetical protein
VKCCNAECNYAGCHYAERHGALEGVSEFFILFIVLKKRQSKNWFNLRQNGLIYFERYRLASYKKISFFANILLFIFGINFSSFS